MYLNLRRSYIALKQSVSEREGQKLDPYTSLDATIMNQPTYEDIKGTRHGDRGQATTMNQPDYDDIKATRHGDRGQETTMKQPDYDDTIATTHGDRDHATTINQPDYDDTIATRNGDRGYTNEIEGVEYENQTIVKKTARVQESNLGIADENTEPEYELPIEKRSYIALKQSVSEREGQKLDPYTSLDATIMNQPAYEDIKATRHGDRGQATTMKQPVYDDIKATIHGDRGHTNEIEGVEYENQTIVKQTARVQESNLGVADENTEPEYELPIEK
eukprot:XP_011661839.1 PREDICTED: uncharacterized protein LOC105437212 [Strongylocentrotus purpuratus]